MTWCRKIPSREVAPHHMPTHHSFTHVKVTQHLYNSMFCIVSFRWHSLLQVHTITLNIIRLISKCQKLDFLTCRWMTYIVTTSSQPENIQFAWRKGQNQLKFCNFPDKKGLSPLKKKCRYTATVTSEWHSNMDNYCTCKVLLLILCVW